jgi:uncharacterized protein YbjT (DUF2867 family)
MKILVTGATGYIGGRLVPLLLEAGHEVRVLVRDPSRVQGRPWSSKVDVFTGDLLKLSSLEHALDGIDASYYLVHSMLAGSDFEERDREAAKNYTLAGKKVLKTIYLGGLVPKNRKASRHLQSRTEVGQILRDSLAVTEFRAGPVIGSGSASFEMLRYLTERLPVMITPKWVLNLVQPIAIRDVLSYLKAALDVPASRVVEIGGERLTFKKMMEVFSESRGLHRVIIPVPLLAPKLAARWVGFVTPIPNSMAVPIIEGITESVVADTKKAEELFPNVRPMPFQKAVRLSLERTNQLLTETHWSDALRTRNELPRLHDEEGMIRESRSVHVDSTPELVFHEFMSLGGDEGWLKWEWAWKIRGGIDRMLGGPGLRRGRRNPHNAYPGESIDFWRVEAVEAPHLLRLHAEMKLPGNAWIEWETRPEGSGSRLVQTAFFSPKGLGGFIYWYGLYPIHTVIFGSLIRAIAERAEAARPV